MRLGGSAFLALAGYRYTVDWDSKWFPGELTGELSEKLTEEIWPDPLNGIRVFELPNWQITP